MATKYLILRSNIDKPSNGGLIRGSAGTEATKEDEELTVQTVDGRETDAGTFREDPKNHVVIDADILLSLILPKAVTAADTTTLRNSGTQRLAPGLFAVGAHTSPFTGQGVIVAVLDTGIDEMHPAFANTELVAKNFTADGGEADVADNHGHGTHCAGTICGGSVDGVRVGVAPGVSKLCVGKVLAGTNGGGTRGTAEMMVNGMLWAVNDQKASVVSMSLGFDLPGNTARLVERGLSVSQAANMALRQHAELTAIVSRLRGFLESRFRNVLFLAATGNESERPQATLDASLPASELIAVGAVESPNSGERWQVASFSNGRAQLVAPGVNVVSAARGGGWASMTGTSMATPHVAGVAALWCEKIRDDGLLALSNTVASAMFASATRIPIIDKDVSAIGLGLAQAPQA